MASLLFSRSARAAARRLILQPTEKTDHLAAD
jgi:hypothetical protein